MEKRSLSEMVRRYILLGVGLFILAVGIAFTVRADLGTSPVSSIPYVVSMISPLTIGMATIVLHCVCILVQILVLRKKYQPIQLLQLPIAFVFGYLTDFAMWLTRGMSCTQYWQQCLISVIGILLLGFGVNIEVMADVIILAAEGTVVALREVLPFEFGTLKVAFDTTLVSTAIILSLIFFHRVAGVREGTIAAALLVGHIARLFNRLLLPTVNKLLLPPKAPHASADIP